MLAIPIGMLAYTGIETISNMAEEARDEAKTIPAAINRVRLAVFAIYFTLPAVALSALPVQQRADGTYYTLLGLTEEQGGYAGDPILGLSSRSTSGRCRARGEIYVGLLAATILFLATNAGIIGVSRLVYSMGIHRQMPDALRRLHPQLPHAVDRHPRLLRAWRSSILLPGQATSSAASTRSARCCRSRSRTSPWRGCGATLAGPPAALPRPGQPAHRRLRRAAVRDRRRHASPRLAFVVIAILNPAVAAAGVGWLVLGIVVYLAFRRRHGLDLTSTHKVAIPQPVVDHEAEYDSVLVAGQRDGYDEHVMATATKLAARKRRGIHVRRRS